MSTLLSILLGVTLAALVVVLLTGVIVYARGGELNERYGNKLMNLRVATQFAAVLILALLILVRNLG